MPGPRPLSWSRISSPAALRDLTPSFWKAEEAVLDVAFGHEQLARDLRVGEVKDHHRQDLALAR